MKDIEPEFYTLLNQAQWLEHGPAKIALLEEAVRLADTHNDIACGIEGRIELINAAQFGGRIDVSLPAFTWCLAQFDRDPELFSEHDLLWKMKWIVNSAPKFPEIHRNDIEKLFEEMEQRYRSYGSTLHAVWMVRWDDYWQMGDLDRAAQAYQRFRKARRDGLSDCAACVANREAEYLLEKGQTAQAFRKVQPILQGRLGCMEIPHLTYATILFGALRAGKVAEGLEYHRIGYPMIQRNPAFVPQWGEHLSFLALTGNFAKARQTLERHWAAAMASPTPWERMIFARHAMLALRLMHEHGKPQVKLRAPKDFPLAVDKGGFANSELADWFETEARALAKRFDKRNGNQYCTGLVDEIAERKKYFIDAPLTPARKSKGKLSTYAPPT